MIRRLLVIFFLIISFNQHSHAMGLLEQHCYKWAQDEILDTSYRPLCNDIVDLLAQELRTRAKTKAIIIKGSLEKRNIEALINALKENNKVLKFSLLESEASLVLDCEFMELLLSNRSLEEIELYEGKTPNIFIKQALARNKVLKRFMFFFHCLHEGILPEEIVAKILVISCLC